MTGICLLAATGVLSLTAASVSWAAALSITAAPMAWAEAGDELVTLSGVPGTGGEDGMGDGARFAAPMGIDARGGSVLIADTDNNRIRSYHGGRVVSVAGHSDARDAYDRAVGGYVDGASSAALMNRPTDCLYLGNDRIVVADRDNHAIRVIGPSWIYTLAGTGEAGYQEQGNGKESRFSSPSGLAMDRNGTIYVADTGNHCIRRVTKNGTTSLVAGVPGTGGMKDGPCAEALFLEPEGVAVAEDGTVYVADTGNQRICRIRDGQVTTLAGGSGGTYLDTEYRKPGFQDGQGAGALFRFPQGICVAGQDVLVADTGNHVIRAVSGDGTVKTIAGCGEPGFHDGKPLEAELNHPSDLEWESGILYIMDTGNSALRQMRYVPDQKAADQPGEELLEE